MRKLQKQCLFPGNSWPGDFLPGQPKPVILLAEDVEALPGAVLLTCLTGGCSFFLAAFKKIIMNPLQLQQKNTSKIIFFINLLLR
jgi:hypothetical protein